MPPVYETPGVYVDEMSSLPPSIAQVETAIPAFVGYTKKRILRGQSESFDINVPIKIHSFIDFEEIFGDPFAEKFTVTLSDPSSGSDVPGITVHNPTQTSPYLLNYQVKMYFGNGGGPCWIVSVGDMGTEMSAINIIDILAGLKECEKVQEITLLCIPEAVKLNAIERFKLHNAMLAQCARLENRFVVLDVLEQGNIEVSADCFRANEVGNVNLRYGAAYFPSLKTDLTVCYLDSEVVVTNNRSNGGTNNFNNQTLANIFESSNLADRQLYQLITVELREKQMALYPSAGMCGIYCSVDRNRGVWKAPANVSFSVISGPNINITAQKQANLNVDSVQGKSINVLRTFTGKGTLVWGARTLAGNDNEWRYVSVRRLIINVEESIKRGTEFVVFEPNDAKTWNRVKTAIENFLTNLWRQGALAGAKPADAFFVKVGLGDTMTSLDILEGRMNIEVGLSAVRPAEFIILKFSHKISQA